MRFSLLPCVRLSICKGGPALLVGGVWCGEGGPLLEVRFWRGFVFGFAAWGIGPCGCVSTVFLYGLMVKLLMKSGIF